MKKIAIIGCARSGIGAAKLAAQMEHDVTLYDAKTIQTFKEDTIKQIEALKQRGVKCLLGEPLVVAQYDLFIVSPGVPLDIPLLEDAKAQGKQIIGEFQFAYQYCQAPVVAITGTNGKTTTTALVGEIIKAYNEQTYIVGNIGRAFSEDVLTIPKGGCVVAEVSSFQLETTTSFHPKVSALLNITPDHLNRHKTMANYCEAKYSITNLQEGDDVCVLNAKDGYCQQLAKRTKAKVAWFDCEEAVDYGTYAKDGIIYEKMGNKANEVCHVKDLKVVGKHNLENVLAAIAITKAIGVPLAVIQKVVKDFKGVAHRLEYVATKSGVAFYNDSKATNVGAAIPGLLSMYKPIRLIGGGMDKGSTFEEWTKYFKGRVEKVYVIGETKDQIIQDSKKQGFDQVEGYASLEEAVQMAYQESKPGEVILLSPACASWDMFESYEQRGELFKTVISQLEG